MLYEFGHPEWRSPLTGRTSEEILEQRKTTARNNEQISEHFRAQREKEQDDVL